MRREPTPESAAVGTLYRAYGLTGSEEPHLLYVGKTINSLSTRFGQHRKSDQDRRWWPLVHYRLTLIRMVPVHLLEECEDMELEDNPGLFNLNRRAVYGRRDYTAAMLFMIQGNWTSPAMTTKNGQPTRFAVQPPRLGRSDMNRRIVRES